MHPILAHPGRLGLYLGAWLLPVSGLLTTLLTVSGGLPRLQALALAIPLSLVYAFVCLASWYPSRALPTAGTRFLEVVATHALAAAISSGVWLLAGLAWSILLDRLPWFHNTFRGYNELLGLFFVVGVLLYVLAVVANYLLIASEASREAESRNLELQVQTRDAELRQSRRSATRSSPSASSRSRARWRRAGGARAWWATTCRPRSKPPLT